MTRIGKPNKPATSTRGLDAGFDKVKDAIDDLQTSRGTVNVAKLEKKINASGDIAARKALDTTKDEFSERTTRFVSDCSGRRSVTSEAPPKTLDKTEVQSIFSALIDAKSKVAKLDKNKDGVISATEGKRASRLRRFSGAIVKAAVGGSQAEYDSAMSDWRYALADTADTIESRQSIDDDISSVARFHAKTQLGTEALTWALREMATRDPYAAESVVDEMDDVLNRAESSDGPPLHAMFSFADISNADLRRGHLDTGEVKHLLGTDDLRGFIKETRSTIEDRVGGSYHRSYLKGKDLPGHDQLKDPDFVNSRPQRYDSGC